MKGKTKFFAAGNTGMVRLERVILQRGTRRRLLSFAFADTTFEKGYLPAYKEREGKKK